MRILIVVPSLKSGGLERVASLFANDLINFKNSKIIIISLNSSHSFYHLDSKIKIIGFDYKFGGRFFKIIPLFFWALNKIYKLKPDKVLSFGEGHNSFVLILCLILKIRNVFIFNRASPLSSLKGLRGLINPILYKFSRALIVQTNKSKTLIKTKYLKTNIIVLPNPISANSESIAMKDKNLKILNVGYLGGQKNQELLIDYFNSIPDSIKSNWTLHFVGDGPLKNSLKIKVNELNLSDKIFFHGTIKEISKFYNSSSIFAFTSKSEGFPNSLAEAMSFGCACISFDCIAGPSDLITDNHDGFLINISDNEKYIHKLILLMTDLNLRIKFSENSLQKVKLFERNVIVNKLHNIIHHENFN